MAVHLGSLPWPKPPQFSVGSLLGPKPVAVLRWIAAWAEALRSSPLDPCPGRNRGSSPEDRWFDRSLFNAPFGFPPGPKSSAGLPDPGLGRSPCRSPFGSPLPAEALAVHLSGKSVPAEADRFFPAGKHVGRSRHSSRLAPRQSRSSGGSPPKRRAGRGRSVSPVRIPFRAEALPVLLWRSREAEASGSTGLLDEACRSLQMLGASPLRPHGGGFVSRPRLDVSDLRLRSDPKPFPAAAWSLVPRGDQPGHNWNLSWETESSKPNLPVDNEDNGGRIRSSFAGRLRGSADPALRPRSFLAGPAPRVARAPSAPSLRTRLELAARAPPA